VNTRLTQQEMKKLYIDLMYEIRTRIDTIKPCINKETGLDRPIEWEVCFLQLRKICELISLGCLVAHGDIERVHAKDLSKAWNPSTIITEMQKLHSQFFPMATQETMGENGIRGFTPAPAGHLTKDGLLDIYGKAGDALHSGNLRSLVKRRVIKLNFDEISAWTEQIITLLRLHLIMHKGGKTGFICVLKNSVYQNSVTVTTFAKSGPLASPQYTFLEGT
jgi:hypothetical protein